MSMTADITVEYFREYEAICKKALAQVSGAQMEFFDEKTRGRKSRDRVPLNKPSPITKRQLDKTCTYLDHVFCNVMNLS
jgi:hypothetical protein